MLRKTVTFTLFVVAAVFLVRATLTFQGNLRAAAHATAAAFPAFVRGWFGAPRRAQTIVALSRENANLKAEVAALASRGGLRTVLGIQYLEAKIYSSYPFANARILWLDAGAREGVRDGMAVTVATHLLLGQITEVERDASAVRTIFDERFELPVKVGVAGVDALLVGGATPRLTLIVPERTVRAGDRISAASRSVPYGLTVGEVGAVRRDRANAFQEADVAVPYELAGIDAVSINVR